MEGSHGRVTVTVQGMSETGKIFFSVKHIIVITDNQTENLLSLNVEILFVQACAYRMPYLCLTITVLR